MIIRMMSLLILCLLVIAGVTASDSVSVKNQDSTMTLAANNIKGLFRNNRNDNAKRAGQKITSEKMRARIEIQAPQIAENGAEVSVRVIAHNLNSKKRYIKTLRLYSCTLYYRPLFEVNFSGPSMVYGARLKLRRTDSIFALATLNTGETLLATKYVKITYGGCGGGPVAIRNLVNLPPPPAKSAQTWKRSSLPVNSARIIGKTQNVLNLTAMRTDVHISGFRARVLLDMQFYNPSQRAQEEGRFQLRVPDNASPHYVAFGNVILKKEQFDKARALGKTTGFDTRLLTRGVQLNKSTLKEAVMVERNKASSAYYTITGQRRDPALVEWSGNGIYTIRVYPLLKRSHHRVVVAYDMDLPNEKHDYIYRVFGNKSLLKSHVYVYMDAVTKSLFKSSSVDHKSYKTVKSNNRMVHRYAYKLGPDDKATLRFTNTNGYYLTGSDKKTGNYFAIRTKVELARLKKEQVKSNAVFMLDTSAYPGKLTYATRIKLLLAILRRSEHSIDKFSVMMFDVGTHWWQPKFVKNNEANRLKLQDYLNRLTLAGATDLTRAFKQATNPDWMSSQDPSRYKLFVLSNGDNNWGIHSDGAMEEAINRKRVLNLHAYLHKKHQRRARVFDYLVARLKGGVYYYEHEAGDYRFATNSISRAHSQRSWKILGATTDRGREVSLQHPYNWLTDGMEVTIIGRGRAQAKSITLKLVSHDSAGSPVGTTLQVPVPTTRIQSRLTPRIYAEAVVSRLEDYKYGAMYANQALRKEVSLNQLLDTTLMAYAKHFRIARGTATLLMLETKQDYARFKINANKDYSGVINSLSIAKLLEKSQRWIHSKRYATGNNYWYVQLDATPGSQLDQVDGIMLGKQRRGKCHFGDTKSTIRFFKRMTRFPYYKLRRTPAIELRPNRFTAHAFNADWLKNRSNATNKTTLSLVDKAMNRNQKQLAFRLLTSGFDGGSKQTPDPTQVANRMNRLKLYSEGYYFLYPKVVKNRSNANLLQLSNLADKLKQKDLSKALRMLMNY